MILLLFMVREKESNIIYVFLQTIHCANIRIEYLVESTRFINNILHTIPILQNLIFST